MRRRALLLGCAATVAIMSSMDADAAERRPRVGIFSFGPEDTAIEEALAGIGYIPALTIDIYERHASGDVARLVPLARELIALDLDVLYAGGPNVARTVKALSPRLPIVCPRLVQNMPDLYESFLHPGGSVTGVANDVEGMNAKLVQLAAELRPDAKRIGILTDPNDTNAGQFASEVAKAAGGQGLESLLEQAGTATEIAPALERLARGGAAMVIVQQTALFTSEFRAITSKALADRLPTIFRDPRGVGAGGLMGYSIDAPASFHRAAELIAKILKGAKPADLPVEFPTKLDLVINLRTARALGIAVPPSFLARADQVIE